MLFRDKLFCAVEVVVLFVRVTLGSLGILSWFNIKGVLEFGAFGGDLFDFFLLWWHAGCSGRTLYFVLFLCLL